MIIALRQAGYGAPVQWPRTPPLTGTQIRRAVGITPSREAVILKALVAAGLGFLVGAGVEATMGSRARHKRRSRARR